MCEQNCKPGSVFDSHLSRRTVASTLKPPRERPGQPVCSHTGVAPDRVYSVGLFPADGCALTAPFHPYRQSCALPINRFLRNRPPAGGLIGIVKRDPSSLFTQHPCAFAWGESVINHRSLPAQCSLDGGISLLHFSSDRSGRALPVILALWSPDFPHDRPFGLATRLSVLLAHLFY